MRTLRPVKTTATYDRVADQIRRSIHLGEYLPGDRLPPERQLAGQLGVARVTLREALRTLEGEGYLRVISRGGPRGGAVVLKPPVSREEAVMRLARDLPRIHDLYDFYLATEPAAARLAAERRTSDDLAAMAAAIADMSRAQSIGQFQRADSAFHFAVADASRSPLLRQAIEDVSAEMSEASSVFDYILGDPSLARGHERLFAAIERQDGARAFRLAAEHLEDARRMLLEIIAEPGPTT